MNIDYVKLLNVKSPTLILPQGRKSNNQIKMLIGLNFECEVTHLNFPALPFGLRKYTFSSQGRKYNHLYINLIRIKLKFLDFVYPPFLCGLKKCKSNNKYSILMFTKLFYLCLKSLLCVNEF